MYLQHKQGPTFTAKPHRRKVHHYGHDYPQSNGQLAGLWAIIGAGLLFGSLILTTILLLPTACDIEIKKQIGMAQQSQEGQR